MGNVCSAAILTWGELDTVLKFMSPDGDGMIYLESALGNLFASFFRLTREDMLTAADLLGLNRIVDGSDETHGDRGVQGLNDVYNVTNFDSRPRTTEVAFCPASVGCFFRDENEGKISPDADSPPC